MAENDAELIPCPGGCNCFVPRVIVEAVIARREERLRADLAAPDAAQQAAKEIHVLCDELAPDIPGDSTSYAPSAEQIAAIIVKHFATTDALRQARRDDVPGENLRGVLYQTTLTWIEAHPYLKSKLQQGDVGDLTARLAAALRAEGEKGEQDA